MSRGGGGGAARGGSGGGAARGGGGVSGGAMASRPSPVTNRSPSMSRPSTGAGAGSSPAAGTRPRVGAPNAGTRPGAPSYATVVPLFWTKPWLHNWRTRFIISTLARSMACVTRKVRLRKRSLHSSLRTHPTAEALTAACPDVSSTDRAFQRDPRAD